MTRERFDAWLAENAAYEWLSTESGKQYLAKRDAAAAHLRETYNLPDITDPYGYIRAISEPFDPTVLHYPDEYYE